MLGSEKKRLNQQKLMQRRIPTLLGMGVLIVAMIAGVLLFGQGTGVFAPRATPQTTPKKIKITNITDSSFTVSFVTDESTAGFVKYGTEANNQSTQAGDDRDQISGSVQSYTTHHVTVRGLNPNTSYYFVIGTGSNNTFTNQGEPFTVKTAQRSGTQTAAKTIYGSVTNETGVPADGAIVYVKHEDAGELSSLVKSSGSWAIPLSNARKTDGSGFAEIEDTDIILVAVQGVQVAQTAQVTTPIENAQPVETIKYGQTTATAPTQTETEPEYVATESTPAATQAASVATTQSEVPGETEASQTSTASASAVTPNTIVDVHEAKTEAPVVTTTQPKIVGTAKPNVIVTLEVNSETKIVQQVTANENGEFSLDIAGLSQNLEPGEHTVTYTYTDPETGSQVTDTVTFTVADTSNLLAQANQPYGSGNPYPIASPKPSPSPSPSASPSASPSPTATVSASPVASSSASPSARPALPATTSAIPVSGSVGTTLALVFGGLFFIISGVWSFWISSQLHKGKLEL